MSQDLFAAFADPAPPAAANKPQTTQNTSSLLFDDFGLGPSAATGTQHGFSQDAQPFNAQSGVREEIQDDWGDFEEAESVAAPIPPVAAVPSFQPSHTSAVPTSRQSSHPVQASNNAQTRHSTQVLGNANITTSPQTAPAVTIKRVALNPLQPHLQAYREYDPDVLFDADRDEPYESEEEGDETFGDFEEAAPSPLPQHKPSSPSGAGDLLGLDMDVMSNNLQNVSLQPSIPRSSAFDLMGDLDGAFGVTNPPPTASATVTSVESIKPATKAASVKSSTISKPVTQHTFAKTSAVTAPPVKPTSTVPTTPAEDEQWDDFDSWADTSASNVAAQPVVSTSLQFPPTTMSEPSNSTGSSNLPPANIPPPAVILSLFPSILSSTDQTVFRALSSKDSDSRTAIYASPQTLTFLKGYLALLTVAARVIAGRKQRWRRDAILSQSMRIGPAAAGGKGGGMKVAAVDRAETVREEREVEEVVRVWKAQLGRVRAFATEVRKASTAFDSDGSLTVPELATVMPVRTLKELEGGFKAPRACGLCGMNRDERVAKVEGDVHDSFGEWWIEGASMHRSCRNFWHQHEQALRQR